MSEPYWEPLAAAPLPAPGVPNGVATLDASGRIPTTQMPLGAWADKKGSDANIGPGAWTAIYGVVCTGGLVGWVLKVSVIAVVQPAAVSNVQLRLSTSMGTIAPAGTLSLDSLPAGNFVTIPLIGLVTVTQIHPSIGIEALSSAGNLLISGASQVIVSRVA